MLLDDTNAYFHNRLKDYATGKKYVLEDEVGGGDTTVNNLFYEDINNYFENKYITNNEYNSFFTEIFFENEETYINHKTQNYYDYAFYDTNNISTKKHFSNNYYENYFNNIEHKKINFNQITDNSTQLINNKKQTTNQYTENYLLTTNDKKIIYNNISDQTNQTLTTTKQISTCYTENTTQNINRKSYNWYILNDNQTIYYAPSNNTITMVYDDSLIKTRITNAENSITNINTTLNNYNTRITAAENSITSINTTLNDYNTRLNSLEVSRTNHLNRLILLEGAIGLINDRLDNLEKIKYNIFNLSNVIYPSLLGSQNGDQRLPPNTETHILWQTSSSIGSTSGGLIGYSNGQITFSSEGLYEFKFNIDFLQYSAGYIKTNGNITISLYEGNNEIYVNSFSFYLLSADINARSFSIFYNKVSNLSTYIAIKGYTDITTNQTGYQDSLLLQRSQCLLVITKL